MNWSKAGSKDAGHFSVKTPCWKSVYSPRDKDEGDEWHKHGEGAEGEQLHAVLVARKFDQGLQTELRLAAGQADEEGDDVGRETAVRVAMVLEVHHHQQLREQDAVHQIWTHRPANTDWYFYYRLHLLHTTMKKKLQLLISCSFCL